MLLCHDNSTDSEENSSSPKKSQPSNQKFVKSKIPYEVIDEILFSVARFIFMSYYGMLTSKRRSLTRLVEEPEQLEEEELHV